MELTKEELALLGKAKEYIELILNEQDYTGVSLEDITKALQDQQEINETFDSEYAKQVGTLINDGHMTLKEFKKTLNRVGYQCKLGHVKNVRGYIINAIAKETNQAVYKK